MSLKKGKKDVRKKESSRLVPRAKLQLLELTTRQGKATETVRRDGSGRNQNLNEAAPGVEFSGQNSKNSGAVPF